MGKRPHVPTTLHSELSEYSSLLRALRTSSTLDLASQLTTSPATLSKYQYTEDEPTSEKAVNESVCESADGSQNSSSAPNVKGKARDTWTRWPLLAGDVYAPEWGLEDEVKLLALRALRHDLRLIQAGEQHQDLIAAEDEPTAEFVAGSGYHVEGEPTASGEPTDLFEDDDIEQLLTPQYENALTSAAGQYLSTILALLAAHVPSGEKSMQNRVHPIGWQSILDVVAVNGLADQEAIDRIRQRLSMLYPSSSSGPTHCFPDDEPLRRACAAHDLSFLKLGGYSSELATAKHKRGPYRKRRIVDDSASDHHSSKPSKKRQREADG